MTNARSAQGRITLVADWLCSATSEAGKPMTTIPECCQSMNEMANEIVDNGGLVGGYSVPEQIAAAAWLNLTLDGRLQAIAAWDSW